MRMKPLVILFLFIARFGSASTDCGIYTDVLIHSLEPHRPSRICVDNSVALKPGRFIACDRICIRGFPRLKYINKYAHSRQLLIQDQGGTSYKVLSKIEFCSHRNISLAVGNCEHDWRSLEKGYWSSFISPYETEFVDIKMPGSLSVPLKISANEEIQILCLIYLGLGLMMLLLAPIVSKWLPFYYGTGMVVGVTGILLITLYQIIKLLPFGRRGSISIMCYGSLIGFGSFFGKLLFELAKRFLEECGIGISKEMIMPVLTFLLLCIMLMGAWIGFWGVKKFVLTVDGSIDSPTASFVAFVFQVFGAFFILQSSYDLLLAVLMLVSATTVLSLWRQFHRNMPGVLRTAQSTSSEYKLSNDRMPGIYDTSSQEKYSESLEEMTCVEGSPEQGSTNMGNSSADDVSSEENSDGEETSFEEESNFHSKSWLQIIFTFCKLSAFS